MNRAALVAGLLLLLVPRPGHAWTAREDSLRRVIAHQERRLAACEGPRAAARAPVPGRVAARHRTVSGGLRGSALRADTARPPAVALESSSTWATLDAGGPPAEPETWADRLRAGAGVTAGFRWDREQRCPTCPTASPPPCLRDGDGDCDGDHQGEHMQDPAFVGLEERLRVSSRWDVGGNLDRDVYENGHWVSAPHVNARVYAAWHPWRRSR